MLILFEFIRVFVAFVAVIQAQPAKGFFHVHVRIVLLPRIVGVQRLVWLRASGAFPVEGGFELVLDVAVAVVVARPRQVELLGQFEAEDRIEDYLVHVVKRKVESLVQGKLVQRLAMGPRVLDMVDSCFEDILDCLEHVTKYSK